MSLPYSVAVALKEGQALPPQYQDRKLKEPLLVRLMKVTTISADPSLPRGVSCRLTVTMADGRKFASQVDYKFSGLAAPVVSAQRSDQIIELVNRIEACSELGSLMRLTMKAKPARSKSKRA